ncbi:putative ABC transporter permease protein YtcP [Anaerocolumna cellulosilytica]|uniref:Putative ABC transporter permease protein YtcP n=1 Tax=Anaerocolumna cellulosilytica TaxID=433286 RepID=A0A6S6QRJ1_9FIRM|nr:carbohydrate ABC transporter permease [Anaerocolumna cellulosilytica]MBB5196701.1 putative aldouronate transport system permease protein [Anaerocolumna cellulosilytica]BCJ93963.1 putative ABC transporter permease protein YtcP [Anaerocolumna cellulosilytica]
MEKAEKISFKSGHRARAVFLIFNYIFLSVLMLVMLIPLLKVFVDSIDPTTYGIRLIPKVIDLSAYKQIISSTNLYRPLLVSVFTTVSGTAVGLLLTTLAGYVIIQKKMPGRGIMVTFIFITMLFNGGLIPTYLTIKNLGLMNNFIAIIIPCSLSAYNIILMKSFFETIPSTLYEAASLDGCTPMKTFLKIVLPLSKPALASIGLFIAVGLWNEYMHFILYITDTRWQNFQVKVRDLILNDGISGTSITVSQDMLKNAVVVVVVFPFLMIYPFIQKYFTKGVTIGSVKG